MERWIIKYRWWLFALITLGIALVVYERWRDRLESRQDKFIVAAADRYGVPPALVKAVVWRESRFDPRAQGKAGEIGLMQIAELAAREWAEAEKVPWFQHRQLFDPEQNTLAGTWYLGKLLRRYANTDNPVPYALADYNAGRRNVLRWNKGAGATNSQAFIERIDFPSTKRYVQAVIKQFHRYRKTFPDKLRVAARAGLLYAGPRERPGILGRSFVYGQDLDRRRQRNESGHALPSPGSSRLRNCHCG